MSKILHFFLDFDMRCNHTGILLYLKQNKIKVTDDDFIVFMNRQRNMIKMMCRGKEALLHYRSESRILDPGIIQYLPKYLNGDNLEIDKAIKDNLLRIMENKRKLANKEPIHVNGIEEKEIKPIKTRLRKKTLFTEI